MPIACEQKQIAIRLIHSYAEVQDAAIVQDEDSLNLAIIVGFGTTEDTAKTIGEDFVRLVKYNCNDTAPEKEIGPGIYNYLIGGIM
jgi:hypothetical protein